MRQTVGPPTDLLVKDKDGMYLALQSMVTREGTRIADRVVAAFQESLAREGLKSKLRMTYRIAGFPEEAGSENIYLEKVFHQEAA